MPKTLKRCHYFDSNGDPRHSGCPRPATCYFVHPDDPEWESLLPLRPPYQKSPNRGRDRGYKHNTPPRTRDSRLSPPRRESKRSQSPPQRRDSMAYSRRSRSPATSTSSYEHRGRSRHGEASHRSHAADPGRPRRRPSTDGRRKSDAIDRREDKTSIPSALPLHPLLSTSNATEPSNPQSDQYSVLKRPPPPRTAPPLPPPPPLPTPPSFLSSEKTGQTSLPKAELTAEEKQVVWMERVTLMADFANTHAEQVKLGEELETFERLADSWRYSGLPDEDKTRLKAQLTELESRREEKKKSLSSMLARLVESDTWPIGKRPEVQPGVEGKYREMVKYVEELKSTAAEMNNILNDIRIQRESKPDPRNETDVPMDIDNQEGPSRPMKRRRISDNMDDSAKVNPHVLSEDELSDEVEELRERLVAVEDRLSNFENDLNAHDEDLKAELEGVLETRFEELQASKPPDVQPDLGPVLTEKLKEVEENIGSTGAEIGELAEEVGSLIYRSSAVDVEIEQLTRENELYREQFTLMEQKFQGYEEARERDLKAIQALTAALSAHTARPPSPPLSPRTLAPGYVLQFVEGPLLESIYVHVRPLIDDLRASVQDMLRAQNAEIHESLWGKLSLTLRMVENISASMTGGGPGGPSLAPPDDAQ